MSNFIKTCFKLIWVIGMLPSICVSQICNNSGDLIVYSNYEGGVLNINVDQNIPNLKIGVCSYQATQINIFGTFASNVVGVIYAGFNAPNNTNCPPNTIVTTSVSGVSPSSFTIYSNATGNQAIANYLGEELFFSTNIPIANCMVGADGVCGVGSGGGNSSGQITQFFISEFGPGTSLFSHFTQYSCFTGTYNVSSGGNCCAQTPTSAINPIYQGGSNYNFIVPTVTTLCNGSITIDLSNYPVLSQPPTYPGYVWSNGVIGPTVTFTAPGVYSFYVGDYCHYDSTTFLRDTITILPCCNSATIQSIQTLTTVCGLSTGAATINTSPASDSYTWSSGIGSTTNIAAGLAAGNYTVIFSLNNCTASAVITITNSPPPSITSVQTTTTICGLATGAATVNTSPTGISYAWSSGISSTTNLALGLAAGNYTFTASLGGCSASTVVTIISGGSPSINSVQTTTTICGLATGEATVNTNPASSLYFWSSGVSSTTNTAPGLAAGNYTVTASLNGCAASTVITIVSGGPPSIASVQTATTICGLATGAATVNTNPASSLYSWSSGIGSTTNIAQGLAAGNYVVTASLYGCSVSTVVTIVSGGPPSITSIQTSTTICGLATGGATVNTLPVCDLYLWSLGFSSTTSTIAGLAAGNYSVTASLYGCSVSTVITIISGPPPSISSVQTLTSSCNLATGAATVNTIPLCDTYVWSSGINSTTNSATGLTAGSYIVTSSLHGCSVSTTVTIKNPDFPEIPSIQTKTTSFNCSELCASFSLNAAQNQNYTYNWTFKSSLTNSIITSVLFSPEVCFNMPGSYDANVSITNNYGCKTSESYFNIVTVNPKPAADFSFSPDKPNILDRPLVEFINFSKSSVDYSWYNVNTLFSKEVNPALEFKESGDYLVTLIAKNGKCGDTITKKISVLEDFFFYVPNSFSPNGDDLNDYFYPVLTGNLAAKSYRFELFNKWGTSLYSSTNPNETKWDGFYKNDACANDIYQWKITIIRSGFKSIEKTGHVLLIK
jgi:gliding motility-associated-like protein